MTTLGEALASGLDISVCDQCAMDNGATRPDGFISSEHREWPCDVCGRNVPVCALSDWQWPGPAGERMREMREA
jgi:hypothetical protein